jgi:hypothetical protein
MNSDYLEDVYTGYVDATVFPEGQTVILTLFLFFKLTSFKAVCDAQTFASHSRVLLEANPT